VFWKSIREISGKSLGETDLKISENGVEITDPASLAEMFAKFFIKKAADLSSKTTPEDTHDIYERGQSRFLISHKMVQEAVTCLKPKKSFGIDGIPLCIV